METKKGEWEARGNFVYIKNDTHQIASAITHNSKEEESKAIAKLIAAAPEILEALIELKQMFLFNQSKQQSKNNHLNETLIKVDNAINKATK